MQMLGVFLRLDDLDACLNEHTDHNGVRLLFLNLQLQEDQFPEAGQGLGMSPAKCNLEGFETLTHHDDGPFDGRNRYRAVAADRNIGLGQAFFDLRDRGGRDHRCRDGRGGHCGRLGCRKDLFVDGNGLVNVGLAPHANLS